MEISASCFFSQIINIIMIFTHIVGTSFKQLRLISHKISSSINTRFTLLCETLYAGSVKFFAESSEIFMHVVFHLVFVLTTASSECILQGAKKMEVGEC